MDQGQDAGVNLQSGVAANQDTPKPQDNQITGSNGGAVVEEAQQSENTAKAQAEAVEAEKAKKLKLGKWERSLIEKERAEKAELAARLEKLEKQISGKSDPEDAPPKEADFENVMDFLKAERAYELKKFKEDLVKEGETKTETAKQQIEFEEKRKAYSLREAAMIANNPDYLPRLIELNDAGYISEPLKEAIFDSDQGEKIALYLTQNPDDAAKISRLQGKELYRVVGMLEAHISQNQPEQADSQVRQTKAAAPIAPVKSNSQGQKDIKDMNQQEYEAYMHKVRRR